MDTEKICKDLESNQTHDNEEAKKKLVELFTQTKEQWPVHYMLDYFVKSGSKRILEVLVKAQAPHDSYIFDRLDDWLKQQQYRVHAMNVFCFVVRRHPTWLHKIAQHRLIKSVFKLLMHEKDIVQLMSALLSIITLLPIIPNSVPNFMNDLFEVFGHLASWKLQIVEGPPVERVTHLQLGLTMLFHRLYGMYPCHFMSYLSEFVKKHKNGEAIFKHTIRPLLDTVRVHPLLLTANVETEVSNTRWKEMEPHDVVLECAHLSLPVLHPDSSNEEISSAYPHGTPSCSRMTSVNSNSDSHNNGSHPLRPLPQTGAPVNRFESVASESSNTSIWSPLNEITMATGSTAIPLTPTAPFILPLQPSSNNNVQLLGATGSSPPEAAVEATPETTPLKDLRDFKQHQQQQQVPNSHAVRAIFASSQPSSPMRKDQQNQFLFPDVSSHSSNNSVAPDNSRNEPLSNYNRRLLHVWADRQNQQAELPELHSEALLTATQCTTDPNAVQTQLTWETKEIRSDVCVECNETEGSFCRDGGLHMPTSHFVQQLVKGVRRRNRMASYCCNDASFTAPKMSAWTSGQAQHPMRRTKSCSAVQVVFKNGWTELDDEADCPTSVRQQNNANGNGNGMNHSNDIPTQKTVQSLAGSRLQRSGRIMAMVLPKLEDAFTQTVETLPTHYEDWLFELLYECKEQRNEYDRRQKYPQDILDQYIMRCIQAKESLDVGGNKLTISALHEQCQLMCLQFQYERYRRGIHAERNRRLMGRSRDKRSLEMERDRLNEQLKNFDTKNRDLALMMDATIRQSNERQNSYNEELASLKTKYQHELEQNKCLRQANDDLQTRLTAEMLQRKEINYDVESLRGQIFTMSTELQRAQQQADLGQQCKEELARLEAEFIIMGEVQMCCRDRLAEVDSCRAHEQELHLLQESYKAELRDLKHNLDEKTSQLEATRFKISEQQSQLANNEKVITEQKRLLRSVKDEYEEMFKSVNKKYDIQKKIIVQMEEKLMMSLQQPQGTVGHATCSPDTDRTDIASSMERNSPLSTSLASSESLSASLRSTELKNLQQLVDAPSIPEVLSSMASSGGTGPVLGTNVPYEDNARLPAIDLATSAGTASAINIMQTTATAALALPLQELDLPTTSNHTHTHTHPHLHLQQQQQEQQQQQQPAHSQQ